MLKVTHPEADQVVRRSGYIETHNQRPVKSVLTKEFQILSVCVSRKGFLGRFHVENVQYHVWSLTIGKGFTVDAEVWYVLSSHVLLKYILPYFLVSANNIL